MEQTGKANEYREGVTGTTGPWGVRTKTLFRALRDMAGLDGDTLARMLGLNGPQWIHRWERDGQKDPPLDAWRIVESFADLHRDQVDAIVRDVAGRDAPRGTRIDLIYYRSQAEYDAYGRDPGPYGPVDAAVLHAGLLLSQAGYDVAYVAPAGLPPVERAAIRMTRDGDAAGKI